MSDTKFARPDGKETACYVAEPKGAARGNIVVIQEWWGLTPHIKKLCDRFAAEGYRALAPDLYEGEVMKTADEASHKMGHLNWGDAVSQNIAGAVAHLKKSGGKIAVTGFCMGGALTILAAVNLPIDAAIPFYGIPPAEAADPSKIKAPFLGHFAAIDDWCTAELIGKLEAKLKAGGVPYELHRYEGAHHAFMNEGRPEVFDPKASKLAWDRTIAFLRAKVG